MKQLKKLKSKDFRQIFDVSTNQKLEIKFHIKIQESDSHKRYFSVSKRLNKTKTPIKQNFLVQCQPLWQTKNLFLNFF